MLRSPELFIIKLTNKANGESDYHGPHNSYNQACDWLKSQRFKGVDEEIEIIEMFEAWKKPLEEVERMLKSREGINV